MMSEHTPTPWTLDTGELAGDFDARTKKRFCNLILRGFDGQQIMGWGVFKDRDDQIKTDMRYIVTACNAHDELLAVCKVATYYWMDRERDEKREIPILQLLRAVIAKCTPQPAQPSNLSQSEQR
jgi:hypothetical protein